MVSTRISFGLATIAALVACRSASGQWFDFDGGHHHHDQSGHMIDDSGHHIDEHGHHTGRWGVYHDDYGNGWNNYNYTQPYSSNYTPAYSNNIEQNVLPVPSGQAFSGDPIEIRLAASTQGTVKYRLNQYPYTINAGQSQTINADRAWTVRFDRGGNRGIASYALRPGAYEFKVTDNGWELYRSRPAEPPVAP